jgi:hypothetical protein
MSSLKKSSSTCLVVWEVMVASVVTLKTMDGNFTQDTYPKRFGFVMVRDNVLLVLGLTAEELIVVLAKIGLAHPIALILIVMLSDLISYSLLAEEVFLSL